MTKEIAKIRNRGDITIPKNIRRQMKLEVGEHLILVVEGDHVILKKLIL